jgi:hypothetical protein
LLWYAQEVCCKVASPVQHDLNRPVPPPSNTLPWTQGVYKGGLCTYAAEYRRYVPDWQVVHHVHRLCSNLVAGTWHPPHKNVPQNTCGA